ncbi:MAG: DUF4166 domain-containing protein [Xanthobacteraceae bacterium]
MTAVRLKILILGGYGSFGGRLAQLLADVEGLTLIIAGRSREKARAFCAGLSSRASLLPSRFDRSADVEAQLRETAPDIVVDASGPFQSYGGDPYRLVQASIALGVGYLDLADDPDFVKGIARFDAAARERGIFVLSGVSSFPVLTAAVVRDLAQDMAHVSSIAAGIAPSPYAKVGLNVIRAIASYGGRPVRLIREGRPAMGYGLIDSRRYTIGPPGRLPLDPIRFSLVDVPDLAVLPDLWPQLRSIWMGAGPVPAILHHALTAAAWMVRLKLLPSLSPLAPLMHQVMNVLPWGEHRGGMFVAVTGEGPAGEAIERSWELLAEGDDGPLIPSMAAAAVIRRVLDGNRPAVGARPAARDLELADYAPLIARRQIFTGRWQAHPAREGAPLYRRVLGDAFALLPSPLQAMHDVASELEANGVAQVDRGTGLLARLIARLTGFPQAGNDIPVRVAFTVRDGRETWQRTFGGHSFSSVQEQGQGAFARLVCERFGPFRFGLALLVDDGRLRLIVRRWSCFGIPLPRALAPFGDSYEFVEDGRFNFHVEISHPLTGLIVRYRGWLVPDAY